MGLVVPPSNLPITIYQGATFKHSFQWKYGETAETAQPVDLTGATARAQIRKQYSSSTPYVSFTSADGEITLDAQGNIEVSVGPEKTALAPAGGAVWDLEIEWLDGDVCRLLQGKVTVSPEVTR